jgi:hypothetical protein
MRMKVDRGSLGVVEAGLLGGGGVGVLDEEAGARAEGAAVGWSGF